MLLKLEKESDKGVFFHLRFLIYIYREDIHRGTEWNSSQNKRKWSNNQQYDTVIIARNSQELHILLDEINSNRRTEGQKINDEKTKIIVVSRNVSPPTNIEVDVNIMERMEKFKNLGIWIQNPKQSP